MCMVLMMFRMCMVCMMTSPHDPHPPYDDIQGHDWCLFSHIVEDGMVCCSCYHLLHIWLGSPRCDDVTRTLFTSCPLSTIHCPLSTVHYPLSTIHYPLSTVPLSRNSIVAKHQTGLNESVVAIQGSNDTCELFTHATSKMLVWCQDMCPVRHVS